MRTGSKPAADLTVTVETSIAVSSLLEKGQGDDVVIITNHRSLDEGEILEGYLDGVHGYEPNSARLTVSYLHGWRTGMADIGMLEPTAEIDAIDRAYAALRSPPR